MSEALSASDQRPVLGNKIPILLMHLAPLGALYTGFGWSEVLLCIGLYYLRMFFLAAGWHRYFAHRSYKLGRVMQFVMAFGGSMCAQKGVLWWAANHRHHHRYSDKPEDVHSPRHGLWWSHMGWILSDRFSETRFELVKDLTKFPELVWVDRHWWVAPTLLGLACGFLGGPSYLFVSFFLSTVLLYHGTFSVNSLAHVFGRRRYATTDTSRNSLLIALITCGEGWHNNHHHFQSTANQGFFWWEIDLGYYVLKLMSWVGLAHDLRTPPKRLLREKRVADGYFDIGMFEAYWVKAARTLTEAQRQAGQYCDAKRLAVEELATEALAKAQKQAGVYCDAQRQALEELVRATQRQAKELGIVQTNAAGVKAV